MAKDRDDRYPSMMHLLHDLQRLSQSDSARIPLPPTPEERRRAPVLGGRKQEEPSYGDEQPTAIFRPPSGPPSPRSEPPLESSERTRWDGRRPELMESTQTSLWEGRQAYPTGDSTEWDNPTLIKPPPDRRGVPHTTPHAQQAPSNDLRNINPEQTVKLNGRFDTFDIPIDVDLGSDVDPNADPNAEADAGPTENNERPRDNAHLTPDMDFDIQTRVAPPRRRS